MARRLAQLARIPVTELKTVRQKRGAVEALAALDVENVLDLLLHYPRRHLDLSRRADIAELAPGDSAWVYGRVLQAKTIRGRGKARVEVRITDGSAHLRVTFFNQPWRERQLPEGTEAIFFGKLEVWRGTRSMANPEVDLLGEGEIGIRPVYPQSDKHRLYSKDFRRFVAEALERAGDFAEPLPAWVLDRFDFVDRDAAMRGYHVPSSWPEIELARRRLVFDELLRIQLALVLRKRAIERTTKGIRHDVGGPLVARFHERLPFDLTDDQRNAIADIERDLEGPHPMHRLLQGDVGSGKTVVAVSALLAGVQGGHQAAFMAPTEVLAEQHHVSIQTMVGDLSVSDDASLFGNRPVRIELLTSRTTANDRRRILGDLEAGDVDLVVGTHALIQETVAFRSLGVVVIDEQHRFGVEQRAALREKAGGGPVPDVLVMTATPIPRTAAMTVYGDLDVSVIKMMPAGRIPIETRWARTAADEADVWTRVRDEVAAGRQAYVVCPLIEESEKLEARSAEETFQRLDAGELQGLRLGLLHGRVHAAEKDQTMSLFRAGRLDVLVATTVIEVGVDVPNATVMVVLDADRFGIAQLHQLRGRVGRGSARSYCYLIGGGDTPDAEQRLAAMVRTTDGFELAEIDLDIRGEGTIMGERQKGRNDLRLASLRRDRDWVVKAREIAFEIVDADVRLEAHPVLAEEVTLFLDDEDAEFLQKS